MEKIITNTIGFFVALGAGIAVGLYHLLLLGLVMLFGAWAVDDIMTQVLQPYGVTGIGVLTTFVFMCAAAIFFAPSKVFPTESDTAPGVTYKSFVKVVAIALLWVLADFALYLLK